MTLQNKGQNEGQDCTQKADKKITKRKLTKANNQAQKRANKIKDHIEKAFVYSIQLSENRNCRFRQICCTIERTTRVG